MVPELWSALSLRDPDHVMEPRFIVIKCILCAQVVEHGEVNASRTDISTSSPLAGIPDRISPLIV